MSEQTGAGTAAAERSTTNRPPAGRWVIDREHADVAFSGRHLMVSQIRGRFTAITGAVLVEEEMADSRVDVSIDMTSVDSGSKERDAHLRSADLFDVDRYPTATFRSTRVSWDSGAGVVSGDLTIHGVTRPVDLQVTYHGRVQDPWGNERAGFSAHTRINREDFGVSWNATLEAGGLLVGRDIAITIDIETIRQAE